MGGTCLLSDMKSLREIELGEFAERRAACSRRIDSGYGAPCSCAGFASGLWKREYVRCTVASSATRSTAGAAAILARSLFRFFFRC